jgi:hypothetical protein
MVILAMSASRNVCSLKYGLPGRYMNRGLGIPGVSGSTYELDGALAHDPWRIDRIEARAPANKASVLANERNEMRNIVTSIMATH